MANNPIVDPAAHALRLVRTLVDTNEFRLYEPITFPENPYQGCELYIRRVWAFGQLVKDEAELTIDVLNDNGDIIQDFPITRSGFEYLRSRLKFRVDHLDQEAHARK